MPPVPINIFAYTDFRKFLADVYQERKARDRKFSHRFIAEKVKVASSGWFAELIKGRHNLTGTQVLALAKVIHLKSNELDYFEAMVNYGQSQSIDEKMRCLQKMLTFKEVSADLVGLDRLEFYSTWYHGAVRELLFFHPFRGDYAALARMLSPPIRQSEARESVQLLERLGFVEPNGVGGFRAVHVTLKKDPAFPSVVMANFLKANMELAIEALDRFSKEERDVSALTISLSEEAFLKVKEEIRALRKRVLAMTAVDVAPSKVFQCNIQFFPLSQ